MARRYTDFQQVELDTKGGVFRNESELKHAFVEALKKELGGSKCDEYVVKGMLIPALDEAFKSGRRPDIRVSNLVIEVEPPGADLSKGREQLFNYMKELHQQLRGKTVVYGLVTNGIKAEFYEYSGKDPKLLLEDSMANVARGALERFCTQEGKIPVVDAEDLVRLFGV
ncbi:MAG: hypothetical protein QXF58_02195 [Desulfurococcaceae archaeon]